MKKLVWLWPGEIWRNWFGSAQVSCADTACDSSTEEMKKLVVVLGTSSSLFILLFTSLLFLYYCLLWVFSISGTHTLILTNHVLIFFSLSLAFICGHCPTEIGQTRGGVPSASILHKPAPQTPAWALRLCQDFSHYLQWAEFLQSNPRLRAKDKERSRRRTLSWWIRVMEKGMAACRIVESSYGRIGTWDIYKLGKWMHVIRMWCQKMMSK